MIYDVQAPHDDGFQQQRLLLYRPKEDSNWTGEDEIIIAKQREGMVGAQPVVLHRDHVRFKERAEDGVQHKNSIR